MVQGVAVTNFITLSNASKEAFKTATLLKTLNVNSLITGEDGVGKKTLAQYILPNATIIQASDFDASISALHNSNQVIFTDLHSSPNLDILIENIRNNDVQVLATSKEYISTEHIDDIFSVKFSIPPLSQRQEDIAGLIEIFLEEASVLFGDKTTVLRDDFIPDVSSNASSLRRQVMMYYLFQDVQEKELMDIMENYLATRLGSNSDYRNFLYLYEAPLIKAGLGKFKSQLKLSDKLGLNRNTLRKKIADNKQYL